MYATICFPMHVLTKFKPHITYTGRLGLKSFFVWIDFFLVKSISDFFHHTPSSDSEKQHPIPAPFMYIIKNSLWYWVVSPAKTGIWSGTNSLTWSMTASKAAAAKALATFASFPTSTASPDLHLLSAEESQLYIRS